MKTLFFNKTGTLTEGRYYCTQCLLEYGTNQGAFLSAVFSLEAESAHPLARGVETHPWYLEIARHPVKGFESHAGLGVCGTLMERGKPELYVAIGNQRFLKRCQMHISKTMRETIDELELMGETVILCGWGGQARGLMSFADTIRHDVHSLLSNLKDLHVKTVMMTGDHDEMIGHLSYVHGLEHLYTRCLPQEKAKKIKNRQDKGEIIGMATTALDEEEALKQADVSILMGAGSQLHTHLADVVIMGRSLLHVPNLIRYVRQVNRALQGGTTLILAYEGAAAILALTGFLSLPGVLLSLPLVIIAQTGLSLSLQKTRIELTEAKDMLWTRLQEAKIVR